MHKSISTALVSCVLGGSLALVSLTCEAQTADNEQKGVLVCYAWSAFPNERLRLDIAPHSPLTESNEERKFDHPRQAAFSVHGKEIGGCGGDTMGTVTGTIVTAADRGAHMGVVAHFSRGNGQIDFCRSFTFDCTTREEGPAPDRWSCQSRNEFDVYHGISELRKVDPTEDPRCSVFENGTFTGARTQAQRYEPDLQAFAGSPMGAMPGRAGMAGGAPLGAEQALPQLRMGQRGLDAAMACYYGHRANGVDDLTARFFCGLRPFPPWSFELDPRLR